MLVKGTFIGAMSGKLNGLVAAHNRGGQYFREHVIPTDPMTLRQVHCRNSMHSLWTQWNTILSEDQRQDWNRWAKSHAVNNRLGDAHTLSGWGQWCRQKFLVFQAIEELGFEWEPGTTPPNGVSPFRDAPTLTLGGDGTSVDLSWNTAEWAGNDDHAAVFVFLSSPLATTINFHKGHKQLLSAIPGDPDDPVTPPINIPVPYLIPAHSRLFYAIRTYSQDWPLPSAYEGRMDVP